MKLSNLLIGLNYQKINYIDVEIEKLSISTTDLAPNTLYFCIRGQNTDGHELASVAIAHGAVALVVDRKLDYDVPQILVEDVRQTVGILAGRFFKQPRDKFKLIGVTGTNGKTTTTYMLKSILETAGYKVGLIGTICNMIGEQKFPAHLTTPDPIELHKIFLQMADAGVDYVVMEVSAHAIALNKMAGVICDVGILTNITQDHLDFFHTFENYRDTKLAFLDKKYCTQAVANIDDNNICEYVINNPQKNVITFGLNDPCEVFATNIKYSMLGTTYFVNLDDNVLPINTRLIGEFNVYNALGAATACLCLNIEPRTITAGLSSCDFVPGRCNIIELKNGAYAVIDYAHTPDGLKNILQSVRAICNGKLYSLFGCGGNRDSTKRSIMGQVSAEMADFTIITSDNPRLEDPDAIIKQVEEGVIAKGGQHICIQNRKEAILYSIDKLNRGDVLIIAGKGAEDYMDIGGKKISYSDFAVLDSVKK